MYTVRLTRVPENGVLTQEKTLIQRADLQLGSPFDPAGASVSWELARMMGKVYGKVHAESGVTLQCSRCLIDFKSEARSTFSVLFEPRPRTPSKGPNGSTIVDDQDDPGPSVVYFDGEEMPLGEEIRQELEMVVPYTALCRQDCHGLCKTCGANLNAGPCACG